jgi:hypothetical protein
MASDASDPKRHGRELEEIRRQFTEVGKRMGSAFEPTSPNDDRDRLPALAPLTTPPVDQPAPPRWPWVAVAALIFLLGAGVGWALPHAGSSNPAPSPSSTGQSPVPAQPPQIQTIASVPKVCIEMTRKGDETIARLMVKQHDRRLAEVAKAYKLASQACRNQASP